MKRFDVMKQWHAGFAAAVTMSEGCNKGDSEHWEAGYSAGYKMRKEASRLLDEYLVLTGREPQSKIRLAREIDDRIESEQALYEMELDAEHESDDL